MTAPPASAAPRDPWQEQGRHAAPSLAHVASAVVVGIDPDHAARVAVGLARAESARRRVALGDLVGDLAPLYAIAGGEDGAGLADCFRHGLSLNEVARESPDCRGLFILPAGTRPIATRDVLEHPRWPRLVNGFTEAGALLLLVAPLDAQGLETLVAATGGVVAVAVPAHRVRRFPVLAAVSAPVAGASRAHPAPRARSPRLALPAALLAAASALAWIAWPRAPAVLSPATPAPAALTGATPAADRSDASARPDIVDVRARVNPADSSRAATFAVEVVAANTFAGADSFVREARDSPFPPATVAPVWSGSGTLSYKLIVGAWRSREGADSLLRALRVRRVLEAGAGAVVRVPYAMLLAEGLDRASAGEAVRGWRERGISAYALLQDDGSVHVFAGAFETPAQAAPLAASLHDAGVTPLVVFRTGRGY